jgi:NAD+ kinase
MKFQKIMSKKIAIIAARNNQQAEDTKDSLVKKFGFIDLTENHRETDGIDIIVAIGGDGLMLHLLHEQEKNPLPIYGINCGTVGFLMNSLDEENFLEKLEKAEIATLYPLRMDVVDLSGGKHSHIAINEVSLLRQTSQIAKIKIEINGRKRMSSLAADGVLISTSAGSTAYNFSAGGPIIPFGAEILALTPISPFRPRKWHGALLPSSSKISFEILSAEKRLVSANADSIEIRNVKEVTISQDKSISFKILFDSTHSLEERIIREQFVG